MDTGFFRVLLDPGRFFEARVQDEPSLKIPALIALVIGVIGAISVIPMMDLTMATLPADMQGLGVILGGVSAIIAFVAAFVVWFVYGGVFHLISTVAFKGQGSFDRTLEFTGYGFLPQVFGSIVGGVLSYQILSGLTVPTIVTPEQAAAFATEMTNAMIANPLTQAATIAGLLFLVWSANIWIFGMKYARGISTRNAFLTVGIPIGLYILYTLITLSGWL